MGKNTLYKNCDTLGVLQNLEEKFDLIYLDAPYFSGSWEIGLNSERKSIRHLIAEEKGCRLADPGEFTKRAFLNGRIDLLEAEAVMDMINAKTNTQRELAVNQITGKVSGLINELRDDIFVDENNSEYENEYNDDEDDDKDEEKDDIEEALGLYEEDEIEEDSYDDDDSEITLKK